MGVITRTGTGAAMNDRQARWADRAFKSAHIDADKIAMLVEKAKRLERTVR